MSPPNLSVEAVTPGTSECLSLDTVSCNRQLGQIGMAPTHDVTDVLGRRGDRTQTEGNQVRTQAEDSICEPRGAPCLCLNLGLNKLRV